MPNKGCGSPRKTKYITPSGFKNFPIRNVQDLHMRVLQNRTYAGVIWDAVGVRSGKAIVRRARALDIRLLHGNTKLRKSE